MSLKERLSLPQAPVFLMDGTAFIYRAFYANREMRRSDGFPTNALYVTARLLLRLLREEAPAHFLMLLDGRGPHFRHEIFPLYKANRDATPEDLTRQFEPIRRFVGALGLPLEISQGCEADDCIASLAARFSAQRSVVIVGADKDLRQCLKPNVFLWDPALKEEKLVSLKSFEEESGLTPAQWPDMQALLGDSSDNIPGIPGVGPKTAAKILKDFPSLEAIRDNFDSLDPKLQEKFRPHLEAMFVYRELTTLRLDVCPELVLDKLVPQPPRAQELLDLCAEYEMPSLRRELEQFVRAYARTGSDTVAGKEQASLFASAPVHPTAREIARADLLPFNAGLEAALVFRNREEGLLLAVDGEEYRYSGSFEELIVWLETARRIVLPDLKQALKMSIAWRDLASRCFDLSLAAYLLSPEERDYSAPRLLTQWPARLELEPRSPALTALDLGRALERRLKQEGLDRLYFDLELPLVPVLENMERRGVAVNPAAFAAFLEEVRAELERLTAVVYRAAGGPFNIRSAQQLGELLFGVLKLAPSGKTRGGQLSTAQETLEKLSGLHPVVDAVLEFRKMEKLRSTYLEPLPRLIDNQSRIHTNFNQTATATGRLSSSNPNLQNIPVRGPLGRRMRACFTAGPGKALISADYSQVELRVLAHMSQDPALLEAFREGADIHARTASLLFDVPPDKVEPDQRRSAKTVNFGLLYGMGPQKLAQDLKISSAQAKAFIERYFSRLGRVKEFYEGIRAEAEAKGCVTTLTGRRRLLPDIRSQNRQLAETARRQAVNTVIQGSAADVIKLAMLAVDADPELARLEARLVLQVHDELLLEAPKGAAEAAGARAAGLMSSVRPGGVEFCVPLSVDWGWGEDWAQAH